MRKLCTFGLLSFALCSTFVTISCNNGESNESKVDVQINKNEKDTHYLKFIENNVELLSLVVIKEDTYDSLLPYFPTFTEVTGYVKYWDGDYNFTDYSKENQFKIYDDKNMIIEIYAYIKKA